MELEPVMEINYKKTYEKYKSIATVTYQSFMLRMREHNMTCQAKFMWKSSIQLGKCTHSTMRECMSR